MNTLRASALCIAVLATNGAAAQDKYQPAIPERSVQQLNQAKALKSAGQPEEAASVLDKLVIAQPEYFAAQYNLGLALAEDGKYAKAVAALEQAKLLRERDSIQDATIYNSLGWVYMMNGETARAEQAFLTAKQHEALLSEESKARLYNNLGWMYLTSGKFDLARSNLNIADKTFNSATARQNLRTLERLQTARQDSARR